MKKSGKIILVLIIVLLLIAMGVGGYFIVKISNDSSKKISSLESEINSLKSEKEDSNVQNKNEVKSDTKENNESVSKNENNSNQMNETEIANEAIRKALKDEDWIIKNVMSVMFDFVGNDINMDKSDYDEHTFTFAKLNSNNGIPVYIIQAEKDYRLAVLVTYENGKVVTSENSIEIMVERDDNVIDIKNGIVREIPDSYDTVPKYYKINGKKFEPILNWNENSDLTRTFYYNGKECSGESYYKYSEEYDKKYNFVNIETPLTDENIDRYVK